jgi:hypothetical protein
MLQQQRSLLAVRPVRRTKKGPANGVSGPHTQVEELAYRRKGMNENGEAEVVIAGMHPDRHSLH